MFVEQFVMSGLRTLRRLHEVCGEITEMDVNTVVGSAAELLSEKGVKLDEDAYRARLKAEAGDIWPEEA